MNNFHINSEPFSSSCLCKRYFKDYLRTNSSCYPKLKTGKNTRFTLLILYFQYSFGILLNKKFKCILLHYIFNIFYVWSLHCFHKEMEWSLNQAISENKFSVMVDGTLSEPFYSKMNVMD